MADPGFPVGGRQPPTHTLFGKNICENKRIGSCWGGVPGVPPLDPPMKYVHKIDLLLAIHKINQFIIIFPITFNIIFYFDSLKLSPFRLGLGVEPGI